MDVVCRCTRYGCVFVYVATYICGLVLVHACMHGELEILAEYIQYTAYCTLDTRIIYPLLKVCVFLGYLLIAQVYT